MNDKDLELAKKYLENAGLSGEIVTEEEFFADGEEDENVVIYDIDGNIEKVTLKNKLLDKE